MCVFFRQLLDSMALLALKNSLVIVQGRLELRCFPSATVVEHLSLLLLAIYS